MNDFVIDTNVILHAQMKGQARQADSIQFFRQILGSDAVWCFDIGFHWDQAKNRSPILSEYNERTLPSMLGMQVLAELARTNRLRFIDKAKRREKDIIRRLVWDGTDRIFVQVAAGSASHVLVSHDVTGFPPNVCADLLKLVLVKVVDSAAALALLPP